MCIRDRYQTFDLTPLLNQGENAIGLALAPGWYKGDMIFDRYHNLYGDTMQAICEVHVTLRDGTEQVIASDLTWKSYPSPVIFSNIYDGEHYDARRELPGWNRPGCQAPASGVVPGTEKVEKLVARAEALRPAPIREQMAKAAREAERTNHERPAPARGKETRDDR